VRNIIFVPAPPNKPGARNAKTEKTTHVRKEMQDIAKILTVLPILKPKTKEKETCVPVHETKFFNLVQVFRAK
jgi:hypothetical protein